MMPSASRSVIHSAISISSQARLVCVPGADSSATRQSVDLGVRREPAEGFLGEYELAFEGDLEHALATLDQVNVVLAKRIDPVSRTESVGLVVSNHAIFDFDFHEALPFGGHMLAIGSMMLVPAEQVHSEWQVDKRHGDAC